MSNSAVTPNLSAEAFSVGASKGVSGAESTPNKSSSKQEFAKVFSNSFESKQATESRKQRAQNQSDRQAKASETDSSSTTAKFKTSVEKESPEVTTKNTQIGQRAGSELPQTGKNNDQGVPLISTEYGTAEAQTNQSFALSILQESQFSADMDSATTTTEGIGLVDNVNQQAGQKFVNGLPPLAIQNANTAVVKSSEFRPAVDNLSQQSTQPTNLALNGLLQNNLNQSIPPLETAVTDKLVIDPSIKNQTNINLISQGNLANQSQLNTGENKNTLLSSLSPQGWQQLENTQHADVSSQRLSGVLKDSEWFSQDKGKRELALTLAANKSVMAEAKDQGAGLNLFDRLLNQQAQTANRTNSAMTTLQANSSSGLSETLLNDTSAHDAALQARLHPVTPKAIPQLQQNYMPLLQLASPVNQQAFGGELGNKLMMMVNQDIQQAQLQLNPKHLGPLEVKISVGQDQQVNVMFTAQNSAVREALDGAAVRLREMLDQQGLNLNEFNVSEESHKHHQQGERGELDDEENETGDSLVSTAEMDGLSIDVPLSTSSESLVDYFA